MENGLKFEEFTYTTQSVRMVEIDGEPWFVFKDICDILSVRNSRNITKRLDEDEKGVCDVDTPGGKQKVVIISEPGLYQSLFMMRPKNARGIAKGEILRREEELRKFRRWVTHEVLPSIRKTGQYIDTENKFSNLCPIKFDRAGCFEIARRKVRDLGLNGTNANLLWRDWYIAFSKEIGFNINTRAKQENIPKIEWLDKHGYMERFCEFIQR